MGNYVNGYLYPRFLFIKSDGTVRETIDLPMTNGNGLVETLEERYVQHELLNHNRVKKLKGRHITFTLNYDQWANRDLLKKIDMLLYYEQIYPTDTIILYPRRDNMNRYFEVIGQNDTIETSLMRGGKNAMGHKGLVLKYSTVWLSGQFYDSPKFTGTLNYGFFTTPPEEDTRVILENYIIT